MTHAKNFLGVEYDFEFSLTNNQHFEVLLRKTCPVPLAYMMDKDIIDCRPPNR